MTVRREFLAQLGALVAASSLDAGTLKAMGSAQAPEQPPEQPSEEASEEAPEWDLSWVDRITAAKNRVVYNVDAIDHGGAIYSAEDVLNQFHAVYGTSDQATCPVIVFRGAAALMGFNDTMWQKYKVGESDKVTDPATHVPATRNIFWKAREGASSMDVASSISALQQRGLVCLVCNRATKGWARELADKTQQKEADVYAELRANLIPGAYLVPSGIFGVVRAQNAGCAYMPGE